MVSLIWTDCDGLCMLQTHAGVEVGAKIQHCQSCGLRSEQDETEEKQVLLVPPSRIKGAVKYWRILSLPKRSLRLVSYFNSLRVVLKDNLFLIPPCQLKQMVLFPFPPFYLVRPQKALWRGTGRRQEPVYSCHVCFSLSHACFLHAEQYLQLLTPNLNWLQISGTGIHKQWTLFHGRGTAETVAWWPFLLSFYNLCCSEAASIDQHLWQMSPLLSIRTVSMNHSWKSNISTKLSPGQLLRQSLSPNNMVTLRKGALMFNYCR